VLAYFGGISAVVVLFLAGFALYGHAAITADGFGLPTGVAAILYGASHGTIASDFRGRARRIAAILILASLVIVLAIYIILAISASESIALRLDAIVGAVLLVDAILFVCSVLKGKWPRGLVCRLRRSKQKQSTFDGQIELKNDSPDEVEIPFLTSPLQYLNLIVHDASGNRVSQGVYGDRFSLLELDDVYVLRLRPWQKYKDPVDLLGTVPEENRQPGVYTVQAVYEFNNLKAVSKPLRVELPGQCGP
jgi:hypothetical protein